MLTQQPVRPLCENCKLSLAKPNGVSKHGFKKWHKYCSSCAKVAYDPNSKESHHKKNKCDKCGFVAEDKCQLDVIYQDGNKNNKAKSNVKTYCANCSRLHRKRQKQKLLLDITIDSDIRI